MDVFKYDGLRAHTPAVSASAMDVSVNAQPAKDGDDSLSGLHTLYQISLN